MMMLLRCVGEAVAAKGLQALAGLVPFGDLIYDLAADAIERYRKQRREDQIRSDAEQVIQASMEEVRQDARQIAREVLADRPREDVAKLEQYLEQIPAVARQSLKRAEDLSGKTIPNGFDLLDPIQLGNLLPRRLPRFQAGEAVPQAPQWRFVELLGAGGFGEVWLACHSFLEQLRAVKFCLDPAARERLLKHEGEVVKRVMAASKTVRDDQHGIVPLVDAYLEGEAPWLAYEYVDGGDLSTIVRKHAGLPADKRGAQSIQYLAALADVIGRFHALENPIIHRDLKPANILLKKRDKSLLLRVTDFGISHVAAERGIRQATLQTPHLSLGETYRGAHTPIYASPQQKRGLKPDVRDDVHALGIIGWQLLLGDLAAERPTGKWRKRLAECQLSDGVLDLLESCWDDEPNERPANAAALAARVRILAAPPTPPRAAPEERASPAPPVERVSRPLVPEFAGIRTGQERDDNGLKLKLCWCPPSKFTMGSPRGEKDRNDNNEDQVAVTLTQGFWLGKYEVTQGDYAKLMGTNPSQFKGAKNPVEQVCWHDAAEFCRKLTEQERTAGRLPLGWEYRLPTEAQWEYACRAGTTTVFHYGNSLSSAQANFNGKLPYGGAAKGKHLRTTTPVGSYQPNEFGLYDMHGNVWEWCGDWFQDTLPGGHDPEVLTEAPYRVLRGGCWDNNGKNCRAAYREGETPLNRDAGYGFRLAAVQSSC